MYHYVKSAGIFLTALFSFSLTVFSDGNAQNKNNLLQNQAADNIDKIWIYFKDKGPQDELQLNKVKQLISERAVKRRLKVKTEENLYDLSDLPVYKKYIEKLKPFIEKMRVRSKWLNAVSIEIKQIKLDSLNQFEFIKKIEPVRGYYRRVEPDNESPLKKQVSVFDKTDGGLNYGNSITQLAQIKVPDLHKMGYYGQGVLICMLDDGFDLLYEHIAFDSLDIVDTWNFTTNNASVTGGGHGTKTLSTIAGYAPGNLIGPAFKASYLLYKTEVNGSETPIEEDYWVAGLERADSIGADITSSSLGYDGWYTYQDMNGETAVTTIAADSAVGKGMLVVNSAGNEYYNPDHNTLIAPADGKKVLAIGAVNSSGVRCGFSSVGPSYDGRIKPDLAAMGESVLTAYSYSSTSFANSSGTSLSCPLTAGAAALLVSAFPDSTPEQIKNALRNTASQANNPDNLLGYGIVDVKAAYNYLAGIDPNIPSQPVLAQNFPNPFNDETTITYTLLNPSEVQVTIYDINGRKVRKLVDACQNTYDNSTIKFKSGNLASGIYFYQLIVNDLSNGKKYKKAKKMILLK